VQQTISLRDGRTATLRNAHADDAGALVALLRAQVDDGRGMVIGVEQIRDAAGVRARLEEQSARRAMGELATTRVAELGSAIVGEGSIVALPPARCRHVGVVALGVHPQAQRLGVGRALLGALLEDARAARLVRIELYVRADNERARALYASEGFTQEAVRRCFVRLDDGSFVDDLVMVRFLDD
jgi:ribosomal protein S18 acetylase RimI-like enzyme